MVHILFFIDEGFSFSRVSWCNSSTPGTTENHMLQQWSLFSICEHVAIETDVAKIQEKTQAS